MNERDLTSFSLSSSPWSCSKRQGASRRVVHLFFFMFASFQAESECDSYVSTKYLVVAWILPIIKRVRFECQTKSLTNFECQRLDFEKGASQRV